MGLEWERESEGGRGRMKGDAGESDEEKMSREDGLR
jgi:hypothetical protein